MSNVIPFRRPSATVVIYDAMITESPIAAEIGKWFLFVEVRGVAGDDCMWQGESHDEARRVAAEVAADAGGLPIIDEVAA
ncbi:hypothetical protein V1281_002602 [Nitrobacteraceae bacterium AZCC 2161]